MPIACGKKKPSTHRFRPADAGGTRSSSDHNERLTDENHLTRPQRRLLTLSLSAARSETRGTEASIQGKVLPLEYAVVFDGWRLK